MHLRFITFFAILWLGQAGLSQPIALHVADYRSAEQSYVDLYLRVGQGSVDWQQGAEGWTAEAECMVLIREIAGDTVYAERVRLQSPVFEAPQDFQQVMHVPLDAGRYEVVAELNTMMSVYAFEVKNRSVGPSLSSLVVSDRPMPCIEGQPGCRTGVQMAPLVASYCGEACEVVFLFAELYGVETLGAKTFVKYGFKPIDGGKEQAAFKRWAGSSAFLQSVPVLDLPAGDYEAFVELYDGNKVLLSTTSTAFHKDQPFSQASADATSASWLWLDSLSEEDLVFDLKSLFPIANQHDAGKINTLVKSDKPEAQRRFLRKYWQREGGDHPRAAYRAYRKVADAVHLRFFNSVGYGTETDRGFIFLRYGQPDDIIAVEDEPEAPPYQVWRYNYITATQQSNVKFLFYNPSLASNDFKLLHSTCRGEYQNPAWEVELYRRAPWDQQGASIQATTVKEGINRNARRIMSDIF